jgi:peptidoglycan/xylan/chitin deacetylase (PgdA/CDA1 family)
MLIPNPAGHRSLLVLGWHNVESTWCFPAAPDTGAAALAAQLRALRRWANVVPLQESLEALRAGRALPPRAVALTFDDGYRDNLTRAVPVLRELGLPATIFLVPEFLSGRVHAWWERLSWALAHTDAAAVEFADRRIELGPPARRHAVLGTVEAMLKTFDESRRHAEVERLVEQLDPRPDYRHDELFLDWDGARELVRAGVAIGSHTMSHAILATETPDAVCADLARSRVLLQDGLGVGVDTLAYPNGQPRDYDTHTVAAAERAGYRFAVTAWQLANNGDTPPYEIRRRLLSPDIPPARMLLGMAKQVVRAG